MGIRDYIKEMVLAENQDLISGINNTLCNVIDQLDQENASLRTELNKLGLMTESYRSKLAKLCKEISHIGHLRSCSYGLSDGPAGDYCNCNLHLRKQLILEARQALEDK